MKQEFVTLYGKAAIEREVLYLRSPYLPFGKTAFARIGFELIWVLLFVVQFFDDHGPKKYVGIVMWGIMLLFRTPNLYDVLFRRSYTTRIPLHRIKSYSIDDDLLGLQTMVTLQLKNSRYKKLIFRKLEHQAEPFTELLSQYIAQPQLA
ncbi:MAG TPA: hypothetical protein VM368_02465 [Flavisolibacter sp.]|nr:hypothetical protein [Flavisolibacter sp.]